MARHNTNAGFSIVETVIVVVVIGVLVSVGWVIHSSMKATNKTTSVAMNTPVVWKTATLQYEKLRFKYPSTWKLTNKSRAAWVIHDSMGDNEPEPSFDDAEITSRTGLGVSSLQAGMTAAAANSLAFSPLPVSTPILDLRKTHS